MRRPRRVLSLVVALVVAGGCLATAGLAASRPLRHAGGPGPGSASTSASPSGTVSADGSVYSPPLRPETPFAPTRLAPGERPPQFVVVGFDGSGDVDQLQAWADLTRRMQSHVTYFLSGVFMLSPGRRNDYAPPRHARGDSDIGFARSQDPIPEVAALLSRAWLEGNDIGTHFNGHFCGPGGVDRWTAADWASEIRQFNGFVDHWRSDNAIQGEPTAYDHTVVVGGRTPCLEGQKAAYLTAMKAAGYRYDTSGTGLLEWPARTVGGLWEFPLQTVQWKGPGGGAPIAMDYNLWSAYNHARPITTPLQRQSVSNWVYATYLAAFHATYQGNRAPLFLGNHMNYWGCDPAFRGCLHTGRLENPTTLQHYGPFVDGLQRAYVTMCSQPDVQCVSYRDMADWLEAQDPATVARLQSRAPVKG